MTRARALWLGVASLWPALFFGVLMPHVFVPLVLSARHSGVPARGRVPPGWFFAWFPIHFAGVAGTVLLLAYLGRLAWHEWRRPLWQRALWIVGLLALLPFSPPVLWYAFVWRPASHGTVSGPADDR